MSTRLIAMATAALALTLPIASQAAAQAQQPGTASQKTSQNSSQSQGNTRMQASNADQQCRSKLLNQSREHRRGTAGAPARS